MEGGLQDMINTVIIKIHAGLTVVQTLNHNICGISTSYIHYSLWNGESGSAGVDSTMTSEERVKGEGT